MNDLNTPASKAESVSAKTIESIFYSQVDVLRTPNSPEGLLAAMKSVLSLLDESIAEDGSNLDKNAFKTAEAYLLTLWNWNKQLTYTIRIMEGLDMPGTDRGVDKIDVLPLPEELRVVASSLREKLKSRGESLGTEELKESVRTRIDTTVA